MNRSDIEDGLLKLGVRPGMGVMAHSSLSSFGNVEGGAMTVIRALQNVVTSEGTIMMPTFNHGVPFQEGGCGIYDPETTPTSNGVIPDTFWRLPDVFRSLDPMNPFAAWGKHAKRYIEFHHRTLTMGPDSPLGMLGADGGYGLFIGVTYKNNTFHHVVEMTTGAPCLGCRTESFPVRLPGGRMVQGRTWGWRSEQCPINDEPQYVDLMKAKRLERTGKVGESPCTLFKLNDCYEVVSDILANGRGELRPCHECLVRPLQGSHTVKSDWDETSNSLQPDSVAWEY